jgi:NAD+ synthase/NAD+ synthase (glutamine-hydrolysing)
MRIALAQINTTVGDLAGNVDLAVRAARDAARGGASIAVFPEMTIPGYPPRDLVEKPSFLDRCEEQLQRLCGETSGLPVTLVAGTVARSAVSAGKQVENVAVVIEHGRVAFRQTKMLLPTYDVFDEGRYFVPGEHQAPWEIAGRPFGITVCEDAWNDKQFWERPLYQRDPVEELAAAGASALISINASPYCMGKREMRRQMFTSIARRHRLPIVYVNLVGGNDQLVFDGSSFAVDAGGAVIAQAASFRDDLLFVDIDSGAGENHAPQDAPAQRSWAGESLPASRAPRPVPAGWQNEVEAVYEALVLGTGDYLRKCGFQKVLIGLSGGIDSSLVAAIAVDAVGAENVVGVAMPGPFSSDHSVEDARALATNLGIRFEIVPISPAYDTILAAVDPLFAGAPRDAAEENIQARLRGLTLMALSNKWGALVLTTGNKSELAVGYCTLYGDMCGGLAVISDVPKTMVYQLCRVANRRRPCAIPERVFTKPPSAELRPGQKDSDSLPDYDTLDKILRDYVEEHKTPAAIAQAHGLPAELVRSIVNKVDRNEYKRQQAAPGLKVTSKAFGMGRRFPIAQRFSG